MNGLLSTTTIIAIDDSFCQIIWLVGSLKNGVRECGLQICKRKSKSLCLTTTRGKSIDGFVQMTCSHLAKVLLAVVDHPFPEQHEPAFSSPYHDLLQ